MLGVPGCGEQDAPVETAMGARSDVRADTVCLRWREFADSNAESNSDRHYGGHLHPCCYSEVGLIDSKPESDADRTVMVVAASGDIGLFVFGLAIRQFHRDKGIFARFVVRER